MERYKKVSESLKKYFSENENPRKGKPGWIPNQEQKLHNKLKAIESWDKRGRTSEEHKKARNKANVYAYRARKKNAIPADADLKLIIKIYENCPTGYHVDHITSLASGGLHHQNNLQYLPASANCSKGKSGKYDLNLAIKWQDVLKNNTPRSTSGEVITLSR